MKINRLIVGSSLGRPWLAGLAIALLLLLAVGRPARSQQPAPVQPPVPGQPPASGQPPVPGQPVDLPPRVKAANTLVDQLVASDFAAATQSFDATMAKLLPADQLREVWQGLLKTTGPFKSRGSVRSQKIGTNEAVLVSCEFEKLKLVTRVVFDAQDRIAGLFFQPDVPVTPYQPPAYAQPTRFTEHEITLNEDPWKLPGTLTVPLGEGPFPAVVLVAGSGPNDRDETIGPNKPLKDLAWGLASRGIVVLRHDKRTRVHGLRMVQSQEPLTVKHEVLDDVLAAVRLLRATPSVDPDRIFVAGHSQGGYLAPRIAQTDAEKWIKGYAILAGNTRPLEVLVWDQVNYLLGLDGSISDDDQQQLDQLKQQIAIVTDPQLAEKRAKRTSDSGQPILGQPVLGQPVLGQPVLGAGLDYWLDLRGYDPVAMAAAMSEPLLVLHADRDYQVTEKDLAGWRKVSDLRQGVTIRQYPRLNHLFLPGEGRSTPAEYMTPSHVDPQVIEDLVAWITSGQ